MGSDEDGVQRVAHDEDRVRREKADEDEGVDYETTASHLNTIIGTWGGGCKKKAAKIYTRPAKKIREACEKKTRGLQKMYSMLAKNDVLL